MTEILIVTVNYKNSLPTMSLVVSLEKCQDINQIKLVIIDNESSDNTRKELESIKENSTIEIQIIPSQINRYYWGGAAFAFKKMDTSQYKWIIICNNDVVFNDPNFFNQLNTIDIDDCPIIGPKIQSSHSKKDLNPFLSNPIPTIQDFYYLFYYYSAFTAKFVHKIGSFINQKLVRRSLNEGKGVGGLKIKNQKSEIKEIYAPHGSCIIFSKMFFEKGGYLDTGFTMYGEEVSTGEIAKSLDLPIHYMPSLSLTHNDHQSTGKSSWKENFLHSKNTYFYLKRKYRN